MKNPAPFDAGFLTGQTGRCGNGADTRLRSKGLIHFQDEVNEKCAIYVDYLQSDLSYANLDCDNFRLRHG